MDADDWKAPDAERTRANPVAAEITKKARSTRARRVAVLFIHRPPTLSLPT